MRRYRLLLLLAVPFLLFALGIGNNLAAEQLSKELNVYNWEDYFGPTTLRDFEKKFGVRVNLEIYEDEDRMMSAIQSQPGKYDVVVASDSMIPEFVEMRLLEELDLGNIPNLKNVGSKFRNPFYDRGNKHSIPYTWGTTGLVINRKFVTEDVDSWSILFNPKYKGKMAMLTESSEVWAVALQYLGYSLNTTDPAELEEAGQLLLKQKELLVGYLDCITIRDKLVSNELWAAHQYCGEGMFAADKNCALEYVIPKEGAAKWIDCFAIPRGAPHKYTAEVFINYINDPKVNAKIMNYLWYASCNIAARPYTLKEILKHPGVYPPKEILRRLEYFQDTGTPEELRTSERIRNRIWSELQLE